MKAEVINYFVPAQVRFSGKQLKQIEAEWIDVWDKDPDVDNVMSEEDILTTARSLGMIGDAELPEGWKV